MVEDPVRLLGRLRLGREEYCQRLLTMLILAGPYLRWNSRSRPSEQGTRFLKALDLLSFDNADWDGQPLFVDEFDLPKRHELEAGCAPDYGLLWVDRLWMVELKTERASHRPTQLPSYLELGSHHYPSCRIDLTYLTPPMPLTPLPVPPGMRFAHITWDQVMPLVAETWGGDGWERRVTAMLLAALDSIGGSWTTWRAEQLLAQHQATPEPVADLAEHARARGHECGEGLGIRVGPTGVPPSGARALRESRPTAAATYRQGKEPGRGGRSSSAPCSASTATPRARAATSWRCPWTRRSLSTTPTGLGRRARSCSARSPIAGP